MSERICMTICRHCLLLVLVSLVVLLAPSSGFSQITENLDIIFQKTYTDGAPPDSLWDWGRSIDCAGDVNNDGYDDIIVAANKPFDDPLNPWLGKAYIFLGGDPIDTIPDLILTGSPYGSAFIRVAGIGDYNGDGWDDVVLTQDTGERAVKVFLGGDPMDTIPDVVLETRPGQSVGTDVAGAGDVNGDSIQDCIVGDYLWDGTDGRALIFLGGSSPDSTPDVILSGNSMERMGMSVGGGGDLNGDGFDDVVVGADANSEAAPRAGKVYGFFGGAPMDTHADVWIRGEGPDHSLGWYGVDIVRHDATYDWIVAGSPYYPNGFPVPSAGKVYVLYGDSAADTLVDAFLMGRTDSSRLGEESSSAGDAAGTGMSAIVSCAPNEHDGSGTTYLWLGNMPLDTAFDARAEGEFQGHQVAWISCGGGDFDGDGRHEFMFCNYAAPLAEHSVWLGKYQETGAAEYRTSRSGVRLNQILQNEPNPFSDKTVIPVLLAEAGSAALEIHDVRGSVVRQITIQGTQECWAADEAFPVSWDGKDDRGSVVPSGVYFARIRSAGQGKSHATKLVVVR